MVEGTPLPMRGGDPHGCEAAESQERGAKAKVIGQRKIARQDLGGLALTHALDELYGFGHAHSEGDDARYEAVTLEAVRSAAQRYFRSEVAQLAVIRGE